MNAKKSLSETEKRILGLIQKGLPDTISPYRDMARELGLETDELLSVLRHWKKDGKLRRIGAVVNHRAIGLEAGAMVVWRVEAERLDEVGSIMAGFEQVSHAYERHCGENWPYNLYTMVHASDPEQLRCTIKRMSEACGVCDYRVLVTERELKKAPPRYVTS